MSVYIVDSNFFIQAHRKIYPLDIAVSFWNKVKQLAEEGKIISIDKVKNEIYENEDELKKWCLANLPDSFFNDTQTILTEYSKVIEWSVSGSTPYTQQARSKFLDADKADAWLVAFALADISNRVIVTYEISEPNIRRAIKIPEACTATGTSFITPIEMFRALGEQF